MSSNPSIGSFESTQLSLIPPLPRPHISMTLANVDWTQTLVAALVVGAVDYALDRKIGRALIVAAVAGIAFVTVPQFVS